MSTTTYMVTVGEVGNEIGHTSRHDCKTDAIAVRAAKRMVRPYNSDGWWQVTTQYGAPIAHGGRRSM